MKTFAKISTPLILVLGVAIIGIGLMTSTAFGQNPSGSQDWPIWTKNGQGAAVAYGPVACAEAGTDFLVGDNARRTSIIIVNVDSTHSVAFCPKGTKDVGGVDDCDADNGLVLKPDAAVTLDRSVRITDGFTCFGVSGVADIRFWAEQ